MCVCVCLWWCWWGSPLLTSVGLFEWADETRIPAEFCHAAERLRQETGQEETVSLRSFITNCFSGFFFVYFDRCEVILMRV